MIEIVWESATAARVHGAGEVLLEQLEGLLTFSVKDGDEYSALTLMSGDKFPPGFIPKVLGYLRRNKHQVKVRDVRVRHTADLTQLSQLRIPLRERDQDPAVRKLLERDIGTLKGVTASGKGNMLAAVAACFPQSKVGIFAPTNELLNELKVRLKTVAGITCGEVTAAAVKPDRVTVCSFDKLNALRKTDAATYKGIVGSFDVILVDESHAAASKTRIKTLKHCSNATRRYGFSATPEDRSDGYQCLTIGYLGPVTSEIEYLDLLESGDVAKAVVKMVVFHHKNPLQRNSYTHFYQANIQNNKARNKLVADLIALTPKPSMTFITLTRHGHLLHDMVARAKKFDAVYVHGKSHKKVIEKAIDDTRRGRIEILIASKKLDTGIDIPALQTILVADAGVSLIKSRQKAGRGMRRPEGKEHFTLIDIYDAGFRNAGGDPIAFERQAVERMQTYVDAGFEVEVVRYDEKTQALVPYR